jgi:hypothetical protein
MMLAYLSHDEVNRDLAQQFAEAKGVLLCPLFARESASTGLSDAVLCDLDSLPSEERAGMLKALLGRSWMCPMAVHSYSLVRSEVKALRAQGVAVFRRLHEGVFANLLQAAGARCTG